MRAVMAVLIGTAALLAALPAVAQQVEIKAKPPEEETRPARVVAPPLHYEQSRPNDQDYYLYGTKVEHDPAFIEPLSSTYENASGSGRMGISGWTAPNQPVGATSTWRDVTGYFALGFSVTWGGPPAKPVPAKPRPQP